MLGICQIKRFEFYPPLGVKFRRIWGNKQFHNSRKTIVERFETAVMTNLAPHGAIDDKAAELNCVADFFYDPNICVFCDGSVHDEPTQQTLDSQIRRDLRAHGYRVIVIRYDRDLEEQIRSYPDVFGISG